MQTSNASCACSLWICVSSSRAEGIVNEEYYFHMSANRQIKSMSMDGLDMSASTMDHIMEIACINYTHEKRQYAPTRVLIKSAIGNTRVTE